MKLKDNCYKISTREGLKFLKYYDDKSTLKKVVKIHRKLEKIKFPYTEPLELNKEKFCVSQNWIFGRPANYDSHHDRVIVHHMLKQLHKTREKIEWQKYNFPTINLSEKWQARLSKFKSSKNVIEPYLMGHYKKIIEMAEESVPKLDESAFVRPKTLLHGDVVHHNFLLNNEPKIIDFDLAVYGDPMIEEILFVHRVLPYMDYDIKTLINEIPELKRVTRYPAYLRYPNEILREWNHFVNSSRAQQKVLLPYLQQLTDGIFVHRTKFLRQLNEF